MDILSLEARIEENYLNSGNSLGWRLLYSPQDVLDGADFAFIGLNPGGTQEDPAHPRFAPIAGSAYEDEEWGAARGQSRLQGQVLRLFARCNVKPSDVLAGNLVPYRSSSWNMLKNKQDALTFGGELWRDILKRTKPEYVVCMGGPVWKMLSEVLNTSQHQSVGLGWGNISGKRASFGRSLLIGLPHLSRFSVIGRQASEEGLRDLFEGISA